eukprot:5530451-Lingulodinium_polyedra.AAC.1
MHQRSGWHAVDMSRGQDITTLRCQDQDSRAVCLPLGGALCFWSVYWLLLGCVRPAPRLWWRCLGCCWA